SLAGQLRGVTDIMMDCYDDPELLEELLQKATEFLCVYANMLKEAGADMLLLAEPLAGVVSPTMAADFSHPFVKKMIESVQDDSCAVIYHNCGAGVPRMLDDLAELGAMIYHFGNAISIKDALQKMPSNVIIMGNVDPAGIVAHGSINDVRQAVDELIRSCGSYENFWLSTGCDVPPDAPWENLVEFMK
ncbi:MAG: methyltransferase, partial [Firmicutes bacterium]|nr:methyltransferase [Bacillota bacterium]